MLSQLKTYYRPQSVDEALALLASNRENTTVIAGGTHINAHMDPQTKTVIDLQSVGLNALTVEEERLTLGAMVRLQTLVESSQVPALLQKMAHREGPNTFRNAATVGGVVVGADGESELLAALLVFEAVVEIQSTAGSKMLPLTEFLAAVPATLNGGLLTAVTLKSTGQTTSARVARTPADRPIVAAVARKDTAGTIHLALCGVANTPILVNPDDLDSLAPPADFRGSAEYRREMAAVLSHRVLAELE